MKIAASAFALLASLAITTPAQAASEHTTTTPLMSFGVGAFDMFDNVEQDQAMDFRAEYRFGEPLWYVVKPFIGLELTSDWGGGAFAGVVADWVIADHWMIAPSFAVGLWGEGGGKDMGFPLEFRSQLEAGYRFDNDWRVTAAISHISNAEIGDENPGSEIGTVYLHVPADLVLPR